MIEILRLPALEPAPLVDGIAFLEECTRYVARAFAPEPPKVLLLGDLELQWSNDLLGWSFETGFEAGALAFRSSADAQPLLRARVLPRSEKLGEAQWLRIVEDVEEWLPATSVGVEGSSHGRVGRGGSPAPLLASALGPLVTPLDQALRAVLREPRELIVASARDVPAHAVRAVRASTLQWLVRRPDAWGALGHREFPTQGSEPLVPVRWSEATRDHPTHRYLAWLLERAADAVDAVAGRLEHAAEGVVTKVSSSWCRARARQMRRAHAIMESARHRSWLRAVPAAPISEAALLAVVDDPAYARVHALLRRFVRPLFALTANDGLEAPVRATFDLYELWCFLALHRVLKSRLIAAKWFRKGVTTERFGEGRGHGARFAADLPHGRFELYFNLTFPGYLARSSSPRFSVSGERRPDVVATWQPASGPSRWMCLDAKYRVREDKVADAFASAHIYRDALRWNDRGGRCQGVLLLIPNVAPRCAPWCADAFFAEHHVGAAWLAPGSNVETVAERVLKTLGVVE